jgi:hypothetical protein
MGPVAQLVFKTSAVVQPTARSVRLRRRSVEPKPAPPGGFRPLRSRFPRRACLPLRTAKNRSGLAPTGAKLGASADRPRRYLSRPLFEYREPLWAEVCSSIEYQEYSLLFDDEIAFLMAESDLIEERKLQAERAAAMRADELRTMPYREYLQTPEWQERASQTYLRFRGRCALCNAAADLQAHHRTYERRGYEEPADLIALCPSCHSLFHEWRDLASA